MSRKYVAISERKHGIDYSVHGFFTVIEPRDVVTTCESNSTVIIHATDIKKDIPLLNEIVGYITSKPVTMYLFTNDSVRHPKLGSYDIYKWSEIVKHRHSLPPPDRKSFDKLINLYPLCLGYLDAHPNPESVRGPLTETAIANRGLTESENWWKGVLGNNLKGIDLKKELSELKEVENIVDNLISSIKAIDSALDDNSRDTAVNVLTQTVERLKGLCYELEKSGRLL